MSNALKSSLGLHEIGDLADLLNEPQKEATGYVKIDINLIDEDPTQPRTEKNPGFSKASISELAESILNSGLLQPITIRKHPEVDGRFMIKDGARRFRASRKNEAEQIAAIIEDEGQKTPARVKIEQLIVNLQHEDNTPEEIAKTISIALAEGMQKKEIAELTGKSPAWVTLHTTLLNLPEPLDTAYNTGKVTDVNIIYELTKLFKKNENDVIDWLNTPGQEYTRGQLKLFQEYLKDKKDKQEIIDKNNDDEDVINRIIVTNESLNKDDNQDDEIESNDNEHGNTISGGNVVEISGDNATEDNQCEAEPGETNNVQETASDQPPLKNSNTGVNDNPDKFKKAIVIVTHDNRPARILLDKRPSVTGYAWLKYEDDGHVFESQLSDVTLVELMEG